MTENLDQIPESKLSRWAYRVSWLPLVGIPLFILLGLASLINIGRKGLTGFWLLKRGMIVVIIMTILAFTPYLFGYCGNLSAKTPFLPTHGKVYEYYKDGNPKHMTTYWFSVKHGKCLSWHINGKKLGKGEYRFGKLNGDYETWFNNGQYGGITRLKDGRQHGKKISYYDNGQKWYEGEFRNGKYVGKHIVWDRDGRKLTENTYTDTVNK